MKQHSDTDRSGGDRRTGTYPRHDAAVLPSEGAPPRPAPGVDVQRRPGDAVLRALAHRQADLHRRHAAAGDVSADRRRLEQAMADDRRAFARLLVEHVEDESARAAGRAAFDRHGPVPAAPADVLGRLVYRGTTEVGTELEIVERADGEHEVLLAGAVAERVVDRLRLPAHATDVLDLGGTRSRERFASSRAALDALAASGREGATPPWDHADELLADGLVDDHVAVTDRGRRALEQIAPVA